MTRQAKSVPILEGVLAVLTVRFRRQFASRDLQKAESESSGEAASQLAEARQLLDEPAWKVLVSLQDKVAEINRELFQLDVRFRQLVTAAAASHGSGPSKKSDVKKVVNLAAENGGLELLEKIEALQSKRKMAIDEREKQSQKLLEGLHRFELAIQDVIERSKSGPKSPSVPSPAEPGGVSLEPMSRAGIVTAFATTDGVWRISSTTGSVQAIPDSSATSGIGGTSTLDASVTPSAVDTAMG